MTSTIELRALRRLFALPLWLLLAGCSEDEFPNGYLSPGPPGCSVSERRSIELEQGSPLGFAAEDVLAFALGHFETELAWSIPAEYGGLSLTPAAGDTTLSVDIGSEVVRANFVTFGEPDPTTGALSECPDFIELETEVHLVTANGAFDDTFPLVLRAEHVAMVSAVIDLEPLEGSFALEQTGPLTVEGSDPKADRSELGDVTLELGVAPGRVTAQLTAEATLFYDEGPVPGVSSATVPFAGTEAESCYDEDFGGALDGGEAVSRLVARLAQTPSLQFTWSGAAPDRALVARLEASSFCLAPSAPLGLWFSVDVELSDPTSGDVFAVWPLSGGAVYQGDGVYRGIRLASAQPYLDGTFAPAELAETIGDFGVDFSGADAVAFQASLELGTEGIWSGKLTLYALQTVDERDPPCQSEPVASDAGAGTCSGAIESNEVAGTAIFSEIVR